MSVTQKMFAYSSCMLITILTFTHAIPVPMPEEVHPGNILYSLFVLRKIKKISIDKF